jgi:hypothetical protein
MSRMMRSNNEHEEDARSRGTAALSPTTRATTPMMTIAVSRCGSTAYTNQDPESEHPATPELTTEFEGPLGSQAQASHFSDAVGTPELQGSHQSVRV